MPSPSETCIVIVDDNTEVLKTLTRVIEREGYHVRPFESPLEALKELGRAPADLILTDLKMPQMDGIEFLCEVRRNYPSVPVILMTAFATVESAVTATKMGAYDYLKKPFEIAQVFETIEHALKLR